MAGQTDGQMDLRPGGLSDEQTNPLIEMLGASKKIVEAVDLQFNRSKFKIISFQSDCHQFGAQFS